MPQLFSRMDDLNWLTPSIADILDQGAAPPGGDGSIRQQMLTLQQELAELGSPVRIVNMRPTPSYTLFIVQPESVPSARGGKRNAAGADLRRNLGQIAERHKEWRLGYMPKVEDTEYTGIFLRTDDHRPLSLRRLIVRSSFRDHDSTLAAALGVTLDQRLLVRNFETLENLIIIGDSAARSHLVGSIVLTQILFNTPSELRIAVTGRKDIPYSALTRVPHSIGKMVSDPPQVKKIVEGLATEVQRRIDTFYEAGVNLFTAYNNLQREQNAVPIPRILLVLDSLSDESFANVKDSMITAVRDLVLNGSQVGIHVLLAFDKIEDIPEDLKRIVNTEVFMRSAAPELGENIDNFHSSLLRFVDAFVVEQREGTVTPVELCAIKAEEIHAAVDYWNSAADKRTRDSEIINTTSGPTGLTGMLKTQTQTSRLVAEIEERLDVAETLPFVDEAVQMSLSTDQAAMLAAYLGWLSIGALRDVLRYSDSQARDILAKLQSDGVLETSENGVHRFHRLADNPNIST